MKEIIILGTGPVGLIAAIKLSNRFKVTIYDKRDINERTRNQVVVLNRSVLKELPDSNHPSFRYTNPVSIDQNGGIDIPSHLGNKHIQLNELEKLLFEHIKYYFYKRKYHERIFRKFIENQVEFVVSSL
jgi:flavin-dependent dehydrogenase